MAGRGKLLNVCGVIEMREMIVWLWKHRKSWKKFRAFLEHKECLLGVLDRAGLSGDDWAYVLKVLLFPEECIPKHINCRCMVVPKGD